MKFGRWHKRQALRLNLYPLDRCIRNELTTIAYDGLPLDFRVTMPAGIAQYPMKETTSGLIERSDQALYRAKQSGRNRAELG